MWHSRQLCDDTSHLDYPMLADCTSENRSIGDEQLLSQKDPNSSCKESYDEFVTISDEIRFVKNGASS